MAMLTPSTLPPMGRMMPQSLSTGPSSPLLYINLTLSPTLRPKLTPPGAYAQLYPRPLPRNPQPYPIRLRPRPALIPPVPDATLRLLDPLHSHRPFRTSRLCLSHALHPSTDWQPVRRNKFRGAILLHRRRARLLLRRNIHHPNLAHCRSGSESKSAGPRPEEYPCHLHHK